MNNILAIDPSLTSTGYAYYMPDGKVILGRILPKKARGVERLAFIAHHFEEMIANLCVLHRSGPLIVIEGYAMNVKSRQVGRFFDIGELGGVLKLIAYRKGVRILLVPPASLKKFATGKGNADKESVLAAAKAQWHVPTTQNDEVDAYVLLKMGEMYLSPRRRKGTNKSVAIEGCKLIANNA